MNDRDTTHGRARAVLTSALFVMSIAFPTAISSAPRSEPAVIALAQIPAARAAHVLEELFPHARVTVDASTNSVIVVGAARDVAAMREIAAGLDIKSPLAPTVQAFPLHTARASAVVAQLRALFPSARVVASPGGHAVVVSAAPADGTQIASLVAALDAPPALASGASARPPEASDAIRVTQASPRTVAREVANSVHGVRVAVAGGSVVFTGDPDAVRRAKELAGRIDEPAPFVRYTRLYRVAFYDASSVGDLIRRSFPSIALTIDRGLNAVTVFGNASEQRRISDAIDSLNTNPGGGAAPFPVVQPGASSDTFGVGNQAFEVYTLRAALPGINGAASTSATDIASTVTQALQQAAPDLRITVVPTTNQLILSGSPSSMQVARQLIDQLDVAQKLVVLDTQVLELDESVSKNLGLSFTQPLISTNYSEVAPPNDAAGNPQRLLGLGPLTRTPLSLGLTLNLAIANGHGRVLANPRITTISGRTASIRAGDTISIQTTAGGGAGTVATTQLQTFQTGVTLDITPIVNAGNFISVLLHPTVNSETGLLNGIPQISTRDTQTTVALREDETLIIGGLIQENNTRTETKIPLLGDLPLVGPAFRDSQVANARNELVITVTPHIVSPGEPQRFSERGLPGAPVAQALPTIPPTAMLPTERPAMPASTFKAPLTPPPAPVVVPTPAPAASASATATPVAARAATTTGYTYGSIPNSTSANANDAISIYYVSIAPSLPWDGKVVTVNAIVSNNVQRMTMSYGGGFSVQLSPQTQGHWQAVFPFPPAASAALASAPAATLRAMGGDQSAASTVVVPLGGP